MKLTGPELGEFCDILLEAFKEQSLREGLKFSEPSRDLDVLVAKNPFRQMVFDLIDLAHQEGWLDDLFLLLERRREDRQDLVQRAERLFRKTPRGEDQDGRATEARMTDATEWTADAGRGGAAEDRLPSRQEGSVPSSLWSFVRQVCERLSDPQRRYRKAARVKTKLESLARGMPQSPEHARLYEVFYEAYFLYDAAGRITDADLDDLCDTLDETYELRLWVPPKPPSVRSAPRGAVKQRPSLDEIGDAPYRGEPRFPGYPPSPSFPDRLRSSVALQTGQGGMGSQFSPMSPAEAADRGSRGSAHPWK